MVQIKAEAKSARKALWHRKAKEMTGHIRQRSSGSWEIKYDVAGGRDPVTGKRKTRYATVKGTKKVAQQELRRLLAAVDEGRFVEPSRQTVTQYLAQWLADHARYRVSGKTFERYAELLRLHVVPVIGSQPLARTEPLHIQSCHSAMRDRGLSAQTIKHCHRVLSQALKQAVRLRLITNNPTAAVDAPRVTRIEMKVLDQAQTGALLRAAEKSTIYAPVLLAVTTGMRRGEILGLHWRDVDLDRGNLSVAQTLEETKVGGLVLKTPKTERSRRTITLPALTVEAMRQHRVRQAEDRLRAGPLWVDHDLVCCRPDGMPLSPRQLSKTFAALSRRLGLGIRFHDLRHTHMSHLLAAGVHPKVASERAGHASVSITLDVYSHLIPGMQEDAANRIDAALRVHLDR
jgi:integrase